VDALVGLPIRKLDLSGSNLETIPRFTSKARLEKLNVADTDVATVEPLKNSRVSQLWVTGTKVSDLSPLEDSCVVYIECNAAIVSNVADYSWLELLPAASEAGSAGPPWRPLVRSNYLHSADHYWIHL
jgi:Leucine-rich repeat (LRR) protein